MSQPSSIPKGFEAKAPCLGCGQVFRVPERRYTTRVCCSRICDAIRKRSSTLKSCRICKQALPYERFPMNQWGTRAGSCSDCYRPRTVNDVPLVEAAAPCLHCKERYSLRIAPSRIKGRKFCSRQCAVLFRAYPSIKCQACHTQKPRDDFDYTPCGRKMAASCRVCVEQRRTLREAGIGYMATLNYMVRMAKNIADKRNVPYTLTTEQAEAIYHSPCDLCGQMSCVLVSRWSDVGFVDGNVLGRCWACARWSAARSTTRYGQIEADDVLRHARAMVAWADNA